ncbi:GIY-YIG nuclease family protein [Aequorivita echinoideorum]|uniref:GIY-YIG nuclease family protein n=1 Tax=Aequorivita echinoideorum TaxID=1549647 RepID=A0ABS5S2R0_9FLAO|nr:GIY-YIG nuclease family protein [Aequorivita echinoideorum]MBT0607493.1 GIY-YIG nuclease family protein [Aequorivita echinoideorum]
MHYFVYILYSSKLDRYYIGSTENIDTRLREHLWNHRGFTAKAKDWTLKYSETFLGKNEAIKREFQIKKWKSRIRIEKLIDANS